MGSKEKEKKLMRGGCVVRRARKLRDAGRPTEGWQLVALGWKGGLRGLKVVLKAGSLLLLRRSDRVQRRERFAGTN